MITCTTGLAKEVGKRANNDLDRWVQARRWQVRSSVCLEARRVGSLDRPTIPPGDKTRRCSTPRSSQSTRP